MLIVKECGGLGNQMFQYVFAKYLSINNDDVYIDIDSFKIKKYHYGFDMLRAFPDIELKIKEENKLILNQNSILYRCINRFLKIRMITNYECKESINSIRVLCEKINKDVYFDGFWQDIHYINNLKRKDILKYFTFNDKIGGKNEEFLQKIKYENTVSLHVRRGDYILENNLGGICDEMYYKAALEYMDNELKDIVYIVFSDDIKWCRNFFKNRKNFYYVDWNSDEDSYLDMMLMSKCKHNIIANSTFSWWGAWLNTNDDKKIICPKKWQRETSTNKLAFENWILL